jgi:hypothetical protein
MSRRTLGTLVAVLLTGLFFWWLAASQRLAPVLEGLAAVDLRILLLAFPLVVVLQLGRAGRFVLLLERMRQAACSRASASPASTSR